VIARRLLVLLVAVIGILVDTTTIASASTVSQLRGSSRSSALVVSETRVGVADHSAPVLIGGARSNPDMNLGDAYADWLRETGS
jgi:hypothetical protein